MAETNFQFNKQYPFTSPNMGQTPDSKRRKIIGQCPTCQQSFASRSQLRDHMADSHHPPADESDAISFGEMSDYDSLDDEQSANQKPSTHEPTLDQDGFEFSSANQGDFEHLATNSGMFANSNAEQGSVHTVNDENEQPTAKTTPFEQRTQSQPPCKEALGVLYCGTCDKYFGNEKVFKRHFMFGVKHGEEPRDMRDLYYKVWMKSWEDEAKEVGRVSEVLDDMEM